MSVQHMLCDRRGCQKKAVAWAMCDECMRWYRRCTEHGGSEGASRGRRAHWTLWGHTPPTYKPRKGAG